MKIDTGSMDIEKIFSNCDEYDVNYDKISLAFKKNCFNFKM
jgi:hypothetical protein